MLSNVRFLFHWCPSVKANTSPSKNIRQYKLQVYYNLPGFPQHTFFFLKFGEVFLHFCLCDSNYTLQHILLDSYLACGQLEAGLEEGDERSAALTRKEPVVGVCGQPAVPGSLDCPDPPFHPVFHLADGFSRSSGSLAGEPEV